ncbi:hypothetical protein MRX96_042063 [Rhipicephalus microplus]
MSWRSANRPKDYYQERHRNGAGREDFEEPCYCGPPSSHGQRFGGQTSWRAHGPPNRFVDYLIVRATFSVCSHPPLVRDLGKPVKSLNA